MSSWYKPRYKTMYNLRSKIWPYQRSRLRGMVDKRGSVLFRKGFLHRRLRVLKNLKWMQIRRRLGTSLPNFSWRVRRNNKFTHVNQQYKLNLDQKQGFLKSYGKMNNTQLKIFYKNHFIKSKNYKMISLLRVLEMRSHVVLYRMKVFPTIFSAHQFVSHQGILINNNMSKQPSKILEPGDIISLPKNFWSIMVYHLYIRIYNRIHREALNWARNWYKLYWYKRSLKILATENSELFLPKEAFVKVLESKKQNKYLWNKRKLNHFKKVDLYKNKSRSFNKRIFITRKASTLRPNTSLINNKVNFHNKMSGIYLNKNINFNNNNKVKWNRTFSYHWLTNVFIKDKENFIKNNSVENNLMNLYDTKSLNLNLIYFNKKLNLYKKNNNISLEVFKVLRKKIYILSHLNKFQKLFVRLYSWILLNSNKNSLKTLQKFVIIYKIWMKPFTNISNQLNQIEKLSSIINIIGLNILNQKLNNQETANILKNYILLKNLVNIKKMNLYKYILNFNLNEHYFKILNKFLKKFILVQSSFNIYKFNKKSQSVLLKQYIDLIDDQKFSNIVDLNKYIYALMIKIHNDILLNDESTHITNLNNVITSKTNKLNKEGVPLNEIITYIKKELYGIFSAKFNYSLIPELYEQNSYVSMVEHKHNVDNDFKQKLLFDVKKEHVHSVLSNKSLNGDINKHRLYRLRNFFIFYHFLFKHKSKNVNYQMNLVKNVNGLLLKDVESRLKMNFFKESSKNKDITSNIHPLRLQKLNYIMNIYQKLSQQNYVLHNLSKDGDFLKQQNYFMFRHRRSLNNNYDLNNIKNINLRSLRLKLLLKKELIKHKRHRSKTQNFMLEHIWYIPNYIEFDFNTYRAVIIMNPDFDSYITGLGNSNILKPVLGFFSRKGY